MLKRNSWTLRLISHQQKKQTLNGKANIKFSLQASLQKSHNQPVRFGFVELSSQWSPSLHS